MTAQLVRDEGIVKIWELIGSGDEARLEAMLGLYAGLFPQYAHYVPRMRRRAALGHEQRPGHMVHYWLVEVNGQPAGLRTFRYVRNRQCGLAIALAVDPAFRRVTVNEQRLAQFLVYACLDQVIADAKGFGDAPVLGMVNEVETRRLMEHYQNYGIIELPVKYAEPVFPSEHETRSRDEEIALLRFLPISLGFLPNAALNGQAYRVEKVADFVLAFLVDHYGLPVDHPQVRAALDSIPILS
ncbi:MAG TPA: GNAT family N-acetyltransferase [Anaerolineales bacterium]